MQNDRRAPWHIAAASALAAAAAAALAGGGARAAVAAALAGGAASGLAALGFRRAYRESLASVEETARAVAAGDLSRRPPPEAAPRLAAIEAFDAMLDALTTRLDTAEREREQLQTVIGAMEEGVLVADQQGRLLFGNRRLRELFDPPEPLAGRSLREVVRQPRVVETLQTVLAEGRPLAGEVVLGPSPERSLRFQGAPFPAEGPPQGLVAVFHDVSELRRVDAIRRDFAANASHELKTPLTAIRGFAERLADSELAEPGQARAVEAILDNAQRLSHLVEDLLELSRVEVGVATLCVGSLDAGELARGLLAGLEPRLREGKLVARCEGGGWIRAERRTLEQVLGNLLDNAIKYTPAGGEIKVRVGPAPRPDRLRIEVADTGAGIPRKDLPRIFERFYRVDAGRSRAMGGTGLGLAIVRHGVQSMGGEVGVESHLERGSRFWFDLPVGAAHETPIATR